MHKALSAIVAISIGTLLISCQKPTYECACSSDTSSDRFGTVASQAYEENEAEKWCSAIESDTTGFSCNINEVTK